MPQTTSQDSSHTENTVSHALHIGTADLSEDSLRQFEAQYHGLLRLVFDKQMGHLTMTYDAAKIVFSQILPRLAEAGINPVDTWWFRVKTAWYDFTDQNTAAQSYENPKTCCNKIPGA